MTTLPPPKVKKAAEDSLESKIYTMVENYKEYIPTPNAVSYTHLRAHETVLDLVCRLLLETKKQSKDYTLHSLSSTIIMTLITVRRQQQKQ